MFTTPTSGSLENRQDGEGRASRETRVLVRLIVLIGLGASSTLLIACGDDTVATDDADSTDDSSGDPYPVADLAVEYSHEDGTAISYRILCDGDTASVSGTSTTVVAHDACLALADADVAERLISGVPPGRVCDEIYGGSDKAIVTGSLGGTAVDTVVDRTNGCGIDEWDGLLADLLPPARGA